MRDDVNMGGEKADGSKRKTVAVVGGGASGLMAAIWAARCGAKVFLLEHNDKVGKKLLATGNGKCNLTNLRMFPEAYHQKPPGAGDASENPEVMAASQETAAAGTKATARIPQPAETSAEPGSRGLSGFTRPAPIANDDAKEDEVGNPGSATLEKPGNKPPRRPAWEGFPMEVIKQFPVPATMDFFADLGLGFTDHDGYVYPRSGQAASVSDVLRKEAQGLGVETVLDCHVSEVTPPGGRKVFAGDTYETRNDRGRSPSPGERSALSSQSSAGRSADGVWSGADASKSVSGKSRPVSSNRFRLETTQGVLRADAVVIAAGSKATPHSGSDGSGYTLARQLGHNIFPPLPALCGLKLMGSEWRSMAGCRVQGTVKLFVDDVQVAQDTGELQLTDYGVSGIPVFCISRHASIATHQKKAVTLSIDFYPEMEEEELLEFMERRAKRKAGEPWEDFLLGLFPKNLGLTLMRQSDMLRGGVGKLCRLIKSYPATVLAPNGFSLAQVCVGGVDTKEVAARNCASKLVPGLFFCGEVLNVDGVCGGYNLQFAWSSGKAAGCGAAEYLGMGQGDTLAPSAAYDKHENPAKLRASMSKAPGPTTRGRSGDGNLVAKGVSMIKNAPTVRAGAAAANTPKDKPAGQRPLGKTIKKKTLADLSGKRPGPGKRAGKE